MSELIKQAEEVKSKLDTIKEIDRFIRELKTAGWIGVPDVLSIIGAYLAKVYLTDTTRADLIHLFVSYKLQLERELAQLLQEQDE